MVLEAYLEKKLGMDQKSKSKGHAVHSRWKKNAEKDCVKRGECKGVGQRKKLEAGSVLHGDLGAEFSLVWWDATLRTAVRKTPFPNKTPPTPQ